MFEHGETRDHGFLNRILGRVTRAVTKPWHMYPVGLLFGLGFDTVTEVGLLVVAGGAAASGLPWWAILTLPVLFAAGMSLLDSIDGSFMNFAYGWAFAKPVRKIYYNITVTALSVAVALVIGVIELLSILTEKLEDLHKLAKALLEYETLTGDEIVNALKGVMPSRDETETKRPSGPSVAVPISPKPSAEPA